MPPVAESAAAPSGCCGLESAVSAAAKCVQLMNAAALVFALASLASAAAVMQGAEVLG